MKKVDIECFTPTILCQEALALASSTEAAMEESSPCEHPLTSSSEAVMEESSPCEHHLAIST